MPTSCHGGKMISTTLKDVELECPVCENQFRSPGVERTNTLGGRRTDLYERAAGHPQPLPYQLHTCMRCGFTGSEQDYRSELPVSVKEYVWNEIAPEVPPVITGQQKFEIAARIAAKNGADADAIAELWHKAAWCAGDEDDHEAERFYRCRTAEWIERALGDFNALQREEKAIQTYLLAENYRRIGRTELARHWFNCVRDEVMDPSQHWILILATQQRDSPREYC